MSNRTLQIAIVLLALYFLTRPSTSSSPSGAAPTYNRQDVPYTVPYQGVYGLDWF